MFNGKVSVDSSGNITAPAFKGNATSATKATQDGNGTEIAQNYPRAGSNSNNTGFDRVASGQELYRSGLYTITGTDTIWYNLINVRHRNGYGDGVSYGIQIRKLLTNANSTIEVRSQSSVWSGWEQLFRTKSLYDNSSGTTGTVTLSESAANFGYLEIFYKDTKVSGYSSVKVYSPNGKVALLDFINEDGTNVRLATSRAKISGTSITRSNNQVNYAPATSTYDVNEISIYKVIGYR